MTVKVVVDSTSDIPAQLAKELGITVVPAYVVLGGKSYRDRLDITEDEVYARLDDESTFPTTSVPSPQDLAAVYDKLADETDEIISIHVTSKESGIYNSALVGKGLITKKCRIEIIDSLSVAMSYGLLGIRAAKEAETGASLEKVAEVVRETIPRMHLLMVLDTLKYVVRGGRISKPYGLLGSMLRVKPLLTLREGKLTLAGVARTRARAIKNLHDFVEGFPKVGDIAVSYTTTKEDAEALAESLKSDHPGIPLYLTRVGPVLGTHAGPGAMGVAVREVAGD